MGDITDTLRQRVEQAATDGRPLRLVGGGSKTFLGNPMQGELLELGGHSGLVSYEPTELVITARTGTPLRDIEALLAEQGQHLSFDPPHFDGGATLGGVIASGLGGPARPWGGAPRDVLLGTKLMDGQGRVLQFGGQVMKNVAGYDVARLQAGALGTLGILLEVSLKVLPRPPKSRTQVLEMPRDRALARMRELARQPVPLSGACHHEERLYLRLAGSHASVNAWGKRIGGERLAEHTTFWQRLRDHQLEFFDPHSALWRLSLRPNAPRLECEQQSLLDWAGAQRWVRTEWPEDRIRAEVAQYGGHAELFRRGDLEAASFQAMPDALLTLHRRLKQRFDPHNILNPGRLFHA